MNFPTTMQYWFKLPECRSPQNLASLPRDLLLEIAGALDSRTDLLSLSLTVCAMYALPLSPPFDNLFLVEECV